MKLFETKDQSMTSVHLREKIIVDIVRFKKKKGGRKIHLMK